MLLNYINFSLYEINIKGMLNFYKNLKVKKPINILVSNWVDVLEYAYANNKPQIIKPKEADFIYFQQSIILPNLCDFYIHFDINKAKSIANQYHLQTENARALAYSGIEYQPQNDLKMYHFNSKEPIVIVDFPCELKSEKTIIDGNHRMSAAVISNSNITFANFFPHDTLRTIPQLFERAWYCFIVELNQIIHLQTYNQRIDYIKTKSICNDFYKSILL